MLKQIGIIYEVTLPRRVKASRVIDWRNNAEFVAEGKLIAEWIVQNTKTFYRDPNTIFEHNVDLAAGAVEGRRHWIVRFTAFEDALACDLRWG